MRLKTLIVVLVFPMLFLMVQNVSGQGGCGPDGKQRCQTERIKRKQPIVVKKKNDTDIRKTPTKTVKKTVPNTSATLRKKIIGTWSWADSSTGGGLLIFHSNGSGINYIGDFPVCKFKYTLTNDILQMRYIPGDECKLDDYSVPNSKIHFENGFLFLDANKWERTKSEVGED